MSLPATRRSAHSIRRLAVLLLAVALYACDSGTKGAVDIVPPPPEPTPPCPEMATHLHNLAIARPPGATVGAVCRGTWVFGAMGTAGVFVADVHDAADVRIVQTFPQLADARQVAVSGCRLYVANGAAGLAVADITHPAQAVVTGNLAMPGAALDVFAAGARAYVANDQLGLVIVDAGNVAAPRILGIENTPGKAAGVAARGTLVFVADLTDGLRIVNVADPEEPFILKTIAIPGTAADVAVEGDLVAVAAHDQGLQFVDVSDPANASIVGSFATVRSADAVAFGDGVAYAAMSSGGVDIVRVGTPGGPVRIQTLGTPSLVLDVDLTAGRLTASENLAGARVLDVRNPTPPDSEPVLAAFNAAAVVGMGDYIVVADGDLSPGVAVVDGAANAVVGQVEFSPLKWPTDIAIADSIAYVATDGGIPVVDLRKPTTPVVTKTIPLTMNVVTVEDHFIFAATFLGTIIEYDLDGGAPRQVTANNALLTSIAADDDYVCVTDRRGNLLVVPRAGFAFSYRIPLEGSAEGVALRREDGPLGPETRPVAYVAVAGVTTSQASIDCLDLSDITNPTLLWRAACGGKAQSVDIADGWMVVGEGSGGMEMFSADDFGARPIGYLAGPSLRVIFSGKRVAIARGAPGLTLVPIDSCMP